jgi:hypothetical protein
MGYRTKGGFLSLGTPDRLACNSSMFDSHEARQKFQKMSLRAESQPLALRVHKKKGAREYLITLESRSSVRSKLSADYL